MSLQQRSVRVLCTLLLVCGSAPSQSTTGTLLGTVADPGDAAVPSARVELKNAATGAMIG